MRMAVFLAALLATSGCSRRVYRDLRVEVILPDATSCRPRSELGAIELRLLRDGPSSPSLVIRAGEEPRALLAEDGVPAALVGRSEAQNWKGLGYALLTGDATSLLLLPAGTSCPLPGDLGVLPGSAIASDPRGPVLIVGGRDGTGPTRRIAMWNPGDQSLSIARRSLAIPASDAAVTCLSNHRVLVLGGAPIGDTFEVLDLEADPEDPHALGNLPHPVTHATALSLDARTVLVVGGVGADGTASPSVMRIDVDRRATEIIGRTLSARIAPLILRADRTSLWIFGGDSTNSLEHFDLSSGTSRSVALELPPDPQARVALSETRAAFVYQDEVAIVRMGDDETAHVSLTSSPQLQSIRAIATEGGTLLVFGRSADGSGTPMGYRLDPATGETVLHRPAREPSALARASDGTILELAATGVAVRREEEVLPWEDPPAILLFGDDDASLQLDPVESSRGTLSNPAWQREGTELRARVPGARADVRNIRGSAFDLELAYRGAVELLIRGADGAVERLELSGRVAQLGTCSFPLASAENAELFLRPNALSVSGAGECALEAAPPYRISLRALETGAVLSRIRITRRAVDAPL